MTRQEFDSRYAATLSSTDDFTAAELTEINDWVFAAVSDLDLDDGITDSHVKNMFAREFNTARSEALLTRAPRVRRAGQLSRRP